MVLPGPRRRRPATVRDRTLRAPAGPPASWREPASSRSLDPISRVQQALRADQAIAGRYPALAVTGALDAVTRAAVAEFQFRAGLTVTGAVDRATEIALGLAGGLPGLPALPLPLPGTAPAPAPASGAAAKALRGYAKPIATAVGMALTVLTMIDGLGVVPKDARDIVAILFAALTPIAVALIPDYRPTRKGDADAGPSR